MRQIDPLIAYRGCHVM